MDLVLLRAKQDTGHGGINPSIGITNSVGCINITFSGMMPIIMTEMRPPSEDPETTNWPWLGAVVGVVSSTCA